MPLHFIFFTGINCTTLFKYDRIESSKTMKGAAYVALRKIELYI